MICITNYSLIISIIALLVSASALLINIFSYNRKSKIRINGTYVLSSSAACKDQFVNQIILENKKDRAVTILGIYLRIYPNYYIELEDFEQQPLIIKPYETYNKIYGPILYYGINLEKIEMNHLFERKGKKPKYKRRIVLDTSEGKYTVRDYVKHWIPAVEGFKNHYTGWVRPYTIKFKDQYIGSNIKYILTLKYRETEQTILLKEDDYIVVIFNNFQLTKESLTNKQKLIEYLNKMKDSGKLFCETFEVLDTIEINNEQIKTIEAPVINRFQYYIMGRLMTVLSDCKMKRKNKKLAKVNKNQR
jgi:hypothetical protein